MGRCVTRVASLRNDWQLGLPRRALGAYRVRTVFIVTALTAHRGCSRIKRSVPHLLMGAKTRRLKCFRVNAIDSDALLMYQLICTSKDHARLLTQELLPEAKIISVYQEQQW